MLGCDRKKRLRNISLVLMIVMIFNLVSNLSANYVSATEMGINYTLFSKNNIVINNYKTNIQGNIYAGKDLTYTGEEKAEIRNRSWQIQQDVLLFCHQMSSTMK